MGHVSHELPVDEATVFQEQFYMFEHFKRN